MIKLFSLTTFCILMIAVGFGQKSIDTIYYDANNVEVSQYLSHHYVIQKKMSESKYLQESYDNRGMLQASFELSSINPVIREGKSMWYREDGTISQSVYYEKNKVIGLNIRYDNEGKEYFKFIRNVDRLDNNEEFKAILKEFENHLAISNEDTIFNASGTVTFSFLVADKGRVEKFTIHHTDSETYVNFYKNKVYSFHQWTKPIYNGKATNYLVSRKISRDVQSCQ